MWMGFDIIFITLVDKTSAGTLLISSLLALRANRRRRGRRESDRQGSAVVPGDIQTLRLGTVAVGQRQE